MRSGHPLIPIPFTFLMLAAAALGGLAAGCGDDETSGPQLPPGLTTNGVTLKVTRGRTGVLRNPAGAELDASPGTVPTTADSQPGELTFSVEPSGTSVPAPTGYEREGEAFQFGPEGLNFAQRARISLPIANASPAHVIAVLDPVQDEWDIVLSILVAGFADRVWADPIHLSTWTLLSYDPGDPDAQGRIHVRNLDDTRWVSLCVSSVDLANPERDAAFKSEGGGILLSEAGNTGNVASEADVILPQGTWTFQATRTVPIGASFTADPDGWIELDPITVDAAGAGPSIDIDPSTWTGVTLDPPRAPCEPAPDFAFGTGAVQITLTWDDAVDLDLHVVEPSGEEIYYAHRQSATGGQLDRDTQCQSTTTGRPENVVWSATAPSGSYTVKVHLYSVCNSGVQSVAFRVRTVVDSAVRTFEGSVAANETKTVVTFSR